ncbi:MAG: hypothetical protein M3Z05_07405 [Gemmatimonadota bacterium]|nr:hypothetical protein [Gemmatimonadota bacterium]
MRVIAAVIEAIEAEAWAQFHAAIPQPHLAATGSKAMHYGQALSLVTPGADEAVLNRTLGLGFHRPLDAACLESINAAYLTAGCKRWMVEWSPEASPGEGAELIMAAGASERSPLVKMYCDLSRASTLTGRSDHRIEEIGESHRELFRSTVADALGASEQMMPVIGGTLGTAGWHHYLAFSGPRAVAGALMFVKGEGAWLGFAGTLPGERNRGAQSELIARRLADARKLGCKWVTVETELATNARTGASLRNLERAGVAVAYLRRRFLREGRQFAPL